MSEPSEERGSGVVDPTQTSLSQASELLILRAQDGSAGVWNDIDERYRRRLLAFTHVVMGPRLRAVWEPEAAVNEAIVRAFDNIQEFRYRRKDCFYAWLCQQVRRIVLDWGRHERARRPGGVEMGSLDGEVAPEVPDPRPVPSSVAATREVVAKLAEGLEDPRMPSIYRRPLFAVYIECKDRNEVAQELGVTQENLRKQILRGLERWRGILGDDPLRFL